MMGLQFIDCNSFGLELRFNTCILDHCSFSKLKLKGVNFINCHMHGVDFSESQLSNSVFDRCDLSDSVFLISYLEKADFSTAANFNIDPENNMVKGAVFSRENIEGLLLKYKIVLK